MTEDAGIATDPEELDEPTRTAGQVPAQESSELSEGASGSAEISLAASQEATADGAISSRRSSPLSWLVANRRWALPVGVALGAAVLVVVVIAIVVSVLNSTVYSASSAAQKFMDRIGEGKFGDATALADLERSYGTTAGQTGLISASSVQLKAALSDPKTVSQQSVNGTDNVAVKVSYTFEGTPVSGTVTLRADGSDWLFLTKWKVVDASFLGTIAVNAVGADSVSIGGVKFPVSKNDGEVNVLAYPGTYPVSAPSTKWFTFEAKDGDLAAPQGAGNVTLSQGLTALLAQMLLDQTHQAIDTCLASVDNCYIIDNIVESPSDCWGPQNSSGSRNVSATVKAYPEFNASWYPSSSGIVNGDLDVSSAGSVTFTYESEEFFPERWISCTATADFASAWGSWTLSGDELTVDVN